MYGQPRTPGPTLVPPFSSPAVSRLPRGPAVAQALAASRPHAHASGGGWHALRCRPLPADSAPGRAGRLGCLWLGLLAATAAWAAPPPDDDSSVAAAAVAVDASEAIDGNGSDTGLDLAAVARLSLGNRGLAAAHSRQQAAARAAFGSGRLADPEVELALLRWPIDPDAGQRRIDERAAVVRFGVQQRLPRAGALESERQAAEADRASAEADAARDARRAQRDAQLLWVDVAQAEAELPLLEEQARIAATLVEALAARQSAGGGEQQAVLQARIQKHAIGDDHLAARQRIERGRAALRRLIGSAAQQRFAALPQPQALPEPAADEAALQRHPELQLAKARTAAAAAGLAARQAERRPELRLKLAYGYRPEFPDALNLTVGTDLQLLPGRRQQPAIDAAALRVTEAELEADDLRAALAAELEAARSDWRRHQQRLALYRQALLPDAAARVAVLTDAYAANEASLEAVLSARLAHIDLRRAALQQQRQALAAWVRLRYLLAGDRS